MSLAPTETYEAPGAGKPRSVYVIAPRSLMRDELRMARLEGFLEAEFPDLNFVMAGVNKDREDQAAAGVLVGKDGKPQFSDDEAKVVIAKVLDAMHLFINYGMSLQ